MFTTDDIKRTTTKFDEVLSKRPRPRDPGDSPVAYQSLNVVKRLSKAKFPVYLTSSKVNKQNYAMKIFNHRGEKPHPYYKNEIRFAALKHPNIVDIVYYENEKDTLFRGEMKKVSYILMEYAPYGDFFDFIMNHGPEMDEMMTRTYFKQMIEGLEYLHKNGIAHMDLKLENLLLGKDYVMKIADFDLSHFELDRKIISKGTKFYRAPEVRESKCTNTKAADIYAAGIILFTFKTRGILPHSEDNLVGGTNFSALLHNGDSKFWTKHMEVQKKESTFFDQDFKELFIAMTKAKPEDRITLDMIKKSKWYNGPCYSQEELKNKVSKLVGY